MPKKGAAMTRRTAPGLVDFCKGLPKCEALWAFGMPLGAKRNYAHVSPVSLESIFIMEKSSPTQIKMNPQMLFNRSELTKASCDSVLLLLYFLSRCTGSA